VTWWRSRRAGAGRRGTRGAGAVRPGRGEEQTRPPLPSGSREVRENEERDRERVLSLPISNRCCQR
jgi:hypothetical protein